MKEAALRATLCGSLHGWLRGRWGGSRHSRNMCECMQNMSMHAHSTGDVCIPPKSWTCAICRVSKQGFSGLGIFNIFLTANRQPLYIFYFCSYRLPLAPTTNIPATYKLNCACQDNKRRTFIGFMPRVDPRIASPIDLRVDPFIGP